VQIQGREPRGPSQGSTFKAVKEKGTLSRRAEWGGGQGRKKKSGRKDTEVFLRKESE